MISIFAMVKSPLSHHFPPFIPGWCGFLLVRFCLKVAAQERRFRTFRWMSPRCAASCHQFLPSVLFYEIYHWKHWAHVQMVNQK
jgi:hypothetical protein